MGFCTPVPSLSAGLRFTYSDGGSAIKFCAPVGYGSYSIQKGASDSIGTFTLTLTGVVVGSAIRVETQAGALVEFRVATASTEVFSVPTYAGGNPANDLRIKVRKASAAPYYVPYETLATAIVGSQSIFVSQQLDE